MNHLGVKNHLFSCALQLSIEDSGGSGGIQPPGGNRCERTANDWPHCGCFQVRAFAAVPELGEIITVVRFMYFGKEHPDS